MPPEKPGTQDLEIWFDSSTCLFYVWDAKDRTWILVDDSNPNLPTLTPEMMAPKEPTPAPEPKLPNYSYRRKFS